MRAAKLRYILINVLTLLQESLACGEGVFRSLILLGIPYHPANFFYQTFRAIIEDHVHISVKLQRVRHQDYGSAQAMVVNEFGHVQAFVSTEGMAEEDKTKTARSKFADTLRSGLGIDDRKTGEAKNVSSALKKRGVFPELQGMRQH